MRRGLQLRAVLASLGLAVLVAAPAWSEDGSELDTEGPVYWVSNQASRAGGALDSVNEEIIARSAAEFGDTAKAWKPSAPRAAAGKAFDALGRASDWGSILGSLSAGDEVGMANHATNAFLAAQVTAGGVVLGTTLAATVGAPLLVGGVVGALAVGAIYDNTGKVAVDAAWDKLARAKYGKRDRANRMRKARIWVAQANEGCTRARHYLGIARRALPEIEAAEASAEWAEDLLATVRLDFGRVDGSCGQVEGADPAGLTAQLAAQLGELDALVAQASGYADETCRMKSQMSQNSQADAARIWNNTGQYLNGRVGSTATAARKNAEAIRELAGRRDELSRLAETARQQARQLRGRLDETATQVRGAEERIAIAGPAIRQSQPILTDTQAAVEDCDRFRMKASDILETYIQDPSVRSYAGGEVYPIDPPFADLAEVRGQLEQGLAAIEGASARGRQATAQLESWRARLDRCLGSPASGPTGPVDVEARLARLGEIEGRSTRCAQEADVLATGPGGWGTGEVQDDPDDAAPGGWGAGQVIEGTSPTTTAGNSAASGLATAAIQAVNQCQYGLAQDHLGRILDQSPNDAWALENISAVADWVGRVERSRRALGQAQDHLGRGNLDGAFSALATAKANSSPCDRAAIDAVWGQVRREKDRRERAAADERVRRDREARAAKKQRDVEAMETLVTSLGDLMGTLSRAQRGTSQPRPAAPANRPTGGGGRGQSERSGGSASRQCSIIHQQAGNGGYFVIEMPPSGSGAPVGYLVASAPARQRNVCSSARACLEHVLPYRKHGGRIVSEHSSLAAADADARKRCPHPVYTH